MTKRHFWAAGTVALAACFLLCGYEFIRSASNTLFKAAYGAGNLPWAMAWVPVAVLAVLYVYGLLLSRLGPTRTLLVTSIGSGVLIAGFALLIVWGARYWDLPVDAPARRLWSTRLIISVARFSTVLLYLIREAYIVLLIEQYWSFLNSSVDESQAKRLNGAITGVGSLGAVLGGLLVSGLTKPLGTAAMPFFAALALLPAAGVMYVAYRVVGEPAPRPEEESRRHGELGLREFGASPILVLLFVLILLTQIVSTMLDLRFQAVLQEKMPDPDTQTAFSGSFYAALNAVAAVLQFIVTPVVLRLVPLGYVHVAIPAVHVVTCAALLFAPSLRAAGTAYLLFKAFDYSIFRSAKEIFYIPLSFDARYRAKEMIDVFGYRLSKGGISLILGLAKLAGGTVPQAALSVVAMVASAAWLALVVPLRRITSVSPAMPAVPREAPRGECGHRP